MTNKKKPHIAKRIRDCLSIGMGIQATLDSIRSLKDAPMSKRAMYETYGDEIAEGRAFYQEKLLNKANELIEGDSERILELALKSKVGWNPATRLEEADKEDGDENLDAISRLQQLLNRKDD